MEVERCESNFPLCKSLSETYFTKNKLILGRRQLQNKHVSETFLNINHSNHNNN